MSATNRAKLIGKLHTALKKHYTPIVPDSRPLLEHVLYGSLLQDATYELADEGMAKCEQDFFDWNELRVTTVTELAQVLSNFPDPTKAAQRLKGNLQGIFEEFYTFDLDHLRKENLGKAVSKFEKMENMTPFVLAYTVQNGLGGHSIPVDYAALVIMLVTEIVSQSEAADNRVPGLERAIAKNKGVEFGSLLHQCAVALMNDPKDKTARAVLDATSKKSSDRLDEWLASKSAAKKRVRKRKAAEKAAAKIESEQAALAESGSPKAATKKSKAAEEKAEKAKIAALEAAKKKSMAAKSASAKSSAAKKAAAAKPASKAAPTKKSPAKKSPAKKSPTKKSPLKKSPAKKSPVKKSPAKKSPAKKAPAKKSPAKKVTKKKAASKKATTKKASPKKSPTKKSPAKKSSAKKADNRKLTKKKPR